MKLFSLSIVAAVAAFAILMGAPYILDRHHGELHGFDDFYASVECPGTVDNLPVRKGRTHYYQEIDGITDAFQIRGAPQEYREACPD